MCRERDKKRKIRFLYRKAELPGEFIISSVTLRGVSKTSEEIEKKQNEFIEKKKTTQPNQVKTCGSTFKNISNEKKSLAVN